MKKYFFLWVLLLGIPSLPTGVAEASEKKSEGMIQVVFQDIFILIVGSACGAFLGLASYYVRGYLMEQLSTRKKKGVARKKARRKKKAPGAEEAVPKALEAEKGKMLDAPAGEDGGLALEIAEAAPLAEGEDSLEVSGEEDGAALEGDSVQERKGSGKLYLFLFVLFLLLGLGVYVRVRKKTKGKRGR